MKLLVLGASGMLGYSLFQNLQGYQGYEVVGTVRSLQAYSEYFSKTDSIIEGVDVNNTQNLSDAIACLEPDVVLNCIGLIKQYEQSKQHLEAVTINSLLPHQLASICNQVNAKLIHFSTDCIFDGREGCYTEASLPTATDLYGRSKCLGEVSYEPHLTFRTSIIGHELTSRVSLVDWFLSQQGGVSGFSRAIFSGLPTCFIAKLLAEKILPNKGLTGLYHLSVEAIDKFTLLRLIADTYGVDTAIQESKKLVIDRSLDSNLLRSEIDFTPPNWHELIDFMHQDYLKLYKGHR